VPPLDPEPLGAVVGCEPAFGGDIAGVDGAPLELVGLLDTEIEPGAEAGPAPEDTVVGPQAAMVTATAATPTSTRAGRILADVSFGPRRFLAVVVLLVNMPSPPW
jgi:hypothetical protein